MGRTSRLVLRFCAFFALLCLAAAANGAGPDYFAPASGASGDSKLPGDSLIPGQDHPNRALIEALQSRAAEQGALPRDQAPEPEEPPETGPEQVRIEPSSTERLYREMYDTPLASDLAQFGYDLFPRDTGDEPVVVPGPDYVLGPGDRVKVRFWGSGRDFSFTGEIEPDGTLDLPVLGIVEPAGKTVARAESELKRLAGQYAGGVNLRLAPVSLRTMEVFVIGEVARPGLHLVPAYGTVITALNNAGGVRKSGSLRRVSLYRGDKLAGEIDLYDLLLSGSRKADVRLKSRDVVFVPRLGPTAAAAGAVSGPAIYELNGEENAAELLEMAGGPLPQGFTDRVYLRRFNANDEFLIKDLGSPGSLAASTLKDGDMLVLTFADPDRTTAVRLAGHVKRPDVFAWTPGLKLSDVLTGPELLLPEAITDYALLYRFDPETTRRSMKTLPLERIFRGRFDAPLHPRDTIRILSRRGFDIREPVRLSGAVWKDGEYDYMPGLTLMDLLALAGGLKFGANPGRIEISRKNLSGGVVATEHLSVDFTADPDFELRPYDYVLVPQAKDAAVFRTATITGEVRFPGTYRLRRGERLSDLIDRAGGYTGEAYYHGARYTSERARVIQQESIDRLIQELEIRTNQVVSEQMQTAVDKEDADAAKASAAGIRALLAKLKQVKAEGRVAIKLADLSAFRASEYDFPVEDGDHLHVPERPSFVSVVGSVYSPSAYLFREPLSVDDYLEKSGGPTQTADEDYIYVVGADGEVRSRAQDGVSSRSFMNARLMPGDTIVVPEDLDRVPYLRLFKDLTDIVFKIATTAGVVYAII